MPTASTPAFATSRCGRSVVPSIPPCTSIWATGPTANRWSSSTAPRCSRRRSIKAPPCALAWVTERPARHRRPLSPARTGCTSCRRGERARRAPAAPRPPIFRPVRGPVAAWRRPGRAAPCGRSSGRTAPTARCGGSGPASSPRREWRRCLRAPSKWRRADGLIVQGGHEALAFHGLDGMAAELRRIASRRPPPRRWP